VPVAATEKTAEWPAVTVTLAGCEVIAGGDAGAGLGDGEPPVPPLELTVRVAASLVALPAPLVTVA